MPTYRAMQDIILRETSQRTLVLKGSLVNLIYEDDCPLGILYAMRIGWLIPEPAVPVARCALTIPHSPPGIDVIPETPEVTEASVKTIWDRLGDVTSFE